jgi:predicted nuclease of predicted toxin-antitoxin system
MKFKIDENLPIEVADMVRQAGYEASTIYDQNLVGEVDENIAEICQTEQRILVTLDLDFADIRAYPPNEYPGIIVMRVKQQDKPYVLNITARWIKVLPDNILDRRLWIVDDQKIRIRE